MTRLDAANEYKKSHLVTKEVWQLIQEASFFYIAVSSVSGHSGCLWDIFSALLRIFTNYLAISAETPRHWPPDPQGFFLTVSNDSITEVGEHAVEENKVFSMNLSAPFLCQFFKEQMQVFHNLV